MTDQLIQQGVGSTDWTGGRGPAGGTHTGTTTLTMKDGATFVVRHSVAECLSKIGTTLRVYTAAPWTAFDTPNSSVPVVLNSSLIQVVGNVRRF